MYHNLILLNRPSVFTLCNALSNIAPILKIKTNQKSYICAQVLLYVRKYTQQCIVTDISFFIFSTLIARRRRVMTSNHDIRVNKKLRCYAFCNRSIANG